MSTSHTNATNNYLVKTGTFPLPFVQIGWLKATVAANSRFAFSNGDGVTHNSFTQNGINWVASGGVTNTTITPIVTDVWVFAICRWIASGNSRFSMLLHDGSIVHAQNADAHGITAYTNITLGAYTAIPTLFNWDGYMAEYVELLADIAPDANTPDQLVRQLAYRSAFSDPRLRKDILEYRSFRGHVECNPADRVYFRRRNGPQVWTNNNGVINAPHVPHAVPWNSQYVGPWSDDRIVPVYVPDAIDPDTGDATATLSGTAQVGQVLTVTFNDDDPDGAATGITYQWYVDGVLVVGETNTTYTVLLADVGLTITCRVSYTDGLGYAETVETAASDAVIAADSATRRRRKLRLSLDLGF